MRCVMARVLPVPAPASTHIGPSGDAATSRCSGSSAARMSSAVGTPGGWLLIAADPPRRSGHAPRPVAVRTLPSSPDAVAPRLRRARGCPGCRPGRQCDEPHGRMRSRSRLRRADGILPCPPGPRRRSRMAAATPAPPAEGSLTMFSTTWCGYCQRLKRQLEREGIGYTEINIEEDPASADYVMSVNGGNQTVPTVVFPDGNAATNPSLAEVKARLS